MYVELVDGEDEIMNSHVKTEGSRTMGHVSDPTAAIGIRLATTYRRELNRKCEAMNYCLSLLRPEYLKVVCLKFWGTENTAEAFESAREEIELRGYKYEDMKKLVGYGDRQAKRIIRKFVVRVGRYLGEIK